MTHTNASRETVEIALAAEVLHHFGEVRFVARGSSMIPSIYPGDLLTVRSHSIAEARLGQIVLSLREGRFWAHRVVRKWRHDGRLLFATRGDALPHEDPSLDQSQLLGQVASITRYGQPIPVAHRQGPWTKLLRFSVRNSSIFARTLLSRHALRMRLLAPPKDFTANSQAPILECL